MIKVPINKFVTELYAAYSRKDGYIMGSTGQNPQKWSKTSWWFTQYSGKQLTKALYWREHARRVWDCNGLAEGIYKDYTGVDINTKARYNYSTWCGTKGSGLIPVKYRVPGAAVFWSDSGASSIHHVAYLYAPVKAGKPDGDWYIIEARGVNYGVVMTRLNNRKPNFWGIMDKYFDYNISVTTSTATTTTSSFAFGSRTLKKGMKGEDVRELQKILISLGYSCGVYGVDGDFGTDTENALKRYQKDKTLVVNGIADAIFYASLKNTIQYIVITGALVNIRNASNTSGKILGIVKKNTVLEYLNEKTTAGWYKVKYKDQIAWVSGKYAEPK